MSLTYCGGSRVFLRVLGFFNTSINRFLRKIRHKMSFRARECFWEVLVTVFNIYTLKFSK